MSDEQEPIEMPEEWTPPEGRWFGALDRKELGEAGLSEELIEYIDISAKKSWYYRLGALMTLVAIAGFFAPQLYLPIYFEFISSYIVESHGFPEGTYVNSLGFMQIASSAFAAFLALATVIHISLCTFLPGYAQYLAGYYLTNSMWQGRNRGRIFRAIEPLRRKNKHQLTRRIAYLEYADVVRWLIVLVLVTLALAFVDSRSFTAFTDEEVYQSEYFTFDVARRPYVDVERIEIGCHAINDNMDISYELVFADGARIEVIGTDLSARETPAGIRYALNLDSRLRELDVPVFRKFFAPLIGRNRVSLDAQCIQRIPDEYPDIGSEVLNLIRFNQPIPTAPRE